MDSLELFLNTGLAKISTGLAFLLSVIYVLRVANQKLFKNRYRWICYINRVLRKYHRSTGILMVVLGLVHGLYSSESVWSLNWGTACWVFSILLGLNWALRKPLNMKKSWMRYHRLLTVAFLVTLGIHIVDVKWGFGFLKTETETFEDVEIEEEEIVESGEETLENTDSEGSLDTVDGQSDSEISEAADPNSTDMKSTGLMDGVYYGEADGYRPGLKVKVTVSTGEIVGVEIVENNETPKYFENVIPEIPDRIITEQSTDVDVISGATRSCVGIMDAVESAISNQ